MTDTPFSKSDSSLWMQAATYATYLLSLSNKRALLKAPGVHEALTRLSEQPDLSPEQLLAGLSDYLQVNELSLEPSKLSSLSRLSRLSFLLRDNYILPSCYFDSYSVIESEQGSTRAIFLSAPLPATKLTKVQFVNTLMQNRWSIIFLMLAVGTPPVILSALAELLQQPLFDNFVPEGRIPAIILVGIASVMLQITAQMITSISSFVKTYFTQHVDLETKVATAQRFLLASEDSVPKRDAGSWRLTFSVASAYLGSIESLFISIPLAIISMVANLLIVGAFTDFSAIWNLFLILLIPTALSILISYLSSNISVRMMGQRSTIEATIYEVVRQIRGIWLTNTQEIYLDRFARSRSAMSNSLLRSGALEATSGVINNLFQGILYAFIFYQYYTASLDPQKTNLSVGSLLVIYFAIGSLSGSLSSIAGDLVSIAQSLPTYWTPNAIRDMTTFRKPASQQPCPLPAAIEIVDLTYTAENADYPFDKPINITLDKGKSYALVGPSGSGKSTLLSLLVGHLKPRSGTVNLIDGKGQRLTQQLIDSKLLILSQETNLYGSTLHDVIDPSRSYPLETMERACAQMGLDSVLDSLSLRWKTPINEFSRDLSLGQLQRFKIARSLLESFDLILSDEATCHLPEDLHLESIELLNNQSQMHISVLHRLSALHLFDNVIQVDSDGLVSVCPTQEYQP